MSWCFTEAVMVCCRNARMMQCCSTVLDLFYPSASQTVLVHLNNEGWGFSIIKTMFLKNSLSVILALHLESSCILSRIL